MNIYKQFKTQRIWKKKKTTSWLKSSSKRLTVADLIIYITNDRTNSVGKWWTLEKLREKFP